jgi:hypothetical protein
VRVDLLRALYQDWDRHGDCGGFSLGAWASEAGVDDRLAARSAARLKQEGCLEEPLLSDTVRLTAYGALEAGRLGLDPAASARAGELRARILRCLDDGKNADAPDGWVWVGDIDEYTAESAERVSAELGVLLLVEMIECESGGLYRISLLGGQYLEGLDRQVQLVDRFDSLSSDEGPTPQRRGHDLERLIAECVRMQGWEAEERVRASGQETDVLIHREREYYLVECKWEAGPVGPAAIREFAGRLQQRFGARGLFLSMGGFTDAAVDDAKGFMGTAPTYLFGTEDISSLLEGRQSLDDLLNEKVQAAIGRRELVWQ